MGAPTKVTVSQTFSLKATEQSVAFNNDGTFGIRVFYDDGVGHSGVRDMTLSADGKTVTLPDGSVFTLPVTGVVSNIAAAQTDVHNVLTQLNTGGKAGL